MARPIALYSILLNLLIVSSTARSIIEQRQAPPATLPTGWAYKGCYTDSVAARSLQGANGGTPDNNSAATCIAFCAARGYSIAGTEYAHECFCANAISAPGAAANDGCTMACTGAAGEACGGNNRLSVYERGTTTNPTNPQQPAAAAAPAGWGSKGCYSDSVAQRILSTPMGTAGGGAALTPKTCTDACKGANYKYAGVEYSGECFCGNTIQNGHTPQTSGCDMSCNGDQTQMCGGANRINLYEFGATTAEPPVTTAVPPVTTADPPATAGWNDQGCYTDSTAQRALPAAQGVTGAMTQDKCKTACRNAGFDYAGVEYAAECFCGNAVGNGHGPAPDGAAGCNMACAGDATKMCGGPNRLNLFKWSTGGPTASDPPTPTPTPSVPATTATGLPTGWSYKGCWVDTAAARILGQVQPDNQQMTIASCAKACNDLGYSIAGMQYSYQCFCDNVIRNGGKLATADTQCNSPCAGNDKLMCGGPDRDSVYSSQTTLKVVDKPQPVQTVGDWTYQGCIVDPQGVPMWNRVFPWQSVNKTGNSPEWCLSKCQRYGYMAAGLEYGEECYCGDIDGLSKPNVVAAPAGDCNMACPGAPEAICGSGSRLTWYKFEGTPLYTWKYATGAAAGRYQFLVGGPVIPLISQPSINGKIQFLEKKGTGPPNSTGAYEFDPSLAANIFTTFRELKGIKTDLFCGAGLTMPDKAGRLINIGGWSNEATFGVRIMTPDGSPGVNGTSIWKENVADVALQAGRWYPTGMVMANGSMLIVGGQSGSNGPPVPSMEILPRAGGIKDAEYLRRTDPFNLYPFLVVLPSGGIFIQYYNEARILDDVTLDTIKTLPNVPASVNNDKGGRTYPYEGTQVLLPQYYPYTQPLEVLICGGAVPEPNWGIDNCVSIAPDAPDAKWAIERMPSRRVVSCMSTLPDGTYLIMNGGETGEAGFGLAKVPNHNALLYDSRQPKGQRITVMANTTIDRLYHSEAVLMDDGRVLVSGSDPQDPEFAQEYRLEVFLPPYLLDGSTQPGLTIGAAQKDWNYGQAYTVTISANTAGGKFSILGSESSTHGNSMGARILFPQFSCAGTTCTITAPTGKYIAPPGWYRVFYLANGKTPSKAQWVRIGGDPANLGNWPNTADFRPLPGV